MIFNSYTFLLGFLPLVFIGFQLISARGTRGGVAWLVLMSLVYYGWWNPDPSSPWSPAYLALILGSTCANYFFGRYLALHHGPRGKRMLAVGVTANLALLGYYKYSGLFAKTLAALTGGEASIPDVILPLGISFFTFQQIAYLVDAYRQETKEYNFTDYLLFVTFFPQLIAGPIVHHKEMLPQFDRRVGRLHFGVNTSVGLTIIAIGLFKKVVIADNLSPIANLLFDMAAVGERPLTMGEAWVAGVTYALQIYFDFSGYSDIAIGAARLFGIRLPLNFHSPYKATSVVDFWHRWHVTLSRFLRDYLYIPLGGNRYGKPRRYFNLMITMALGGLWHGAGWTFLLWGVLHGLCLCLNHAWFAARKAWTRLPPIPKPVAIVLTFAAVVIAWVPFRAGAYEQGASGSTTAAIKATGSIFASMFGFHGIQGWPDESAYVVKERHGIRAMGCVLLVWFLPNTQQFLRRYKPCLGLETMPGGRLGRRQWWQWRPTTPWAIITFLLFVGTIYQFDKLSDFIYFQF